MLERVQEMRPSITAAILFFAAAGMVFGQTAAPRSFEVASVKMFPDVQFGPNTRSGGRIRRTTTLMGLVLYAYHLQGFQVSGMPKEPVSWYVIDAKTDPSTTDSQIRLMFQTLLADRFQLTAHRETREVNGYALVAGKNGAKIKPVMPEEKPAAMPDYFKGKPAPAFEGQVFISKEGDLSALTGRRVSMSQLAETPGNYELDTFVLDKTGLPGNYYFGLKFAGKNSPLGADGPDLFAALQEELGLRLEKQKGPVEMLIVDHMETVPTENSPEPEPEQPSGPHESQSAPAPLAPQPPSLPPDDLQQSATPAAAPSFEVASVKPAKPFTGGRGGHGPWNFETNPGMLHAGNITLPELFSQAYTLKFYELKGSPSWMSDAAYDIDAKSANNSSREELMLMLRQLLADRFHLKFHREPREIAVMALMVDKNGTRNMEPVKESDPNPPNNRPVMPNQVRTMRNVSMEDLALLLSSSDVMRDTPVINHTGLPGLFNLTYTPVRDETTGRTIFDGIIGALPQLGLGLKRQKATIDIYIIDSADKIPIEN